MSAIDDVFARCAQEKRPAFIPFLMAGDPTLERTPDLLAALARGGADLIEVGVPFSDPIADGPVNQRAAARALASGASLSAILRSVARHRERIGVPLVLFSYFNPILARGLGLSPNRRRHREWMVSSVWICLQTRPRRNGCRHWRITPSTPFSCWRPPAPVPEWPRSLR